MNSYFKISCGHQCSYLCHKGSCSNVNECKTKINLNCGCNRLKKSVFCNQINSENDLIPIKSISGTKFIIKCNEKCDLKREITDFKQEISLNNTKNFNLIKYFGISVIVLTVSIVLMLKFC